MANSVCSLSALRAYKNRSCIVHREALQECIQSYNEVADEIDTLLLQFKELNIPEYVGIGIHAVEHTAGLCALLIGILNHNCYYCPLSPKGGRDDNKLFININRSKYQIADIRSFDEEYDCNFFADLVIFRQTFYIFKRNVHDSKDIFSYTNTHKKFCCCIGTTGSTGKPKAVFVSYASIEPNVRHLSRRFQLSCSDVVFLGSPLTFDTFMVEFFMALQCGAALLLTNSYDRLAPEKLLTILFPPNNAQRGVSLIQMTPSLFRLFGSAKIREVILAKNSSLRILLLGGEEFPTLQELRSWLPIRYDNDIQDKRIFNIYGITEVSCWSALHEIDISENNLSAAKRVPIGAPFDSETNLLILDSAGSTVVGAGQGELWIHSTTRKCQLSTEEEASGNRCTGDLVERDKNGEIFYVGRLDNTVKRLGKRINLENLEYKMNQILLQLNIRCVCLFGKENKKLYCCLKSESPQRVSKLLMKKLACHEKPDHILYIQQFPLNKHGKLDRKQLLNDLENTKWPDHPAKILIRFLVETLGVKLDELQNNIPEEQEGAKRKKFGSDISFLAAGGTSFHALSLHTEIGKLLRDPEDQKTFLSFLLNPMIPIMDILTFLRLVILKRGPSLGSEVTSFRCSELSLFCSKEKSLQFVWRTNFNKCIDSSPVNISDRYICVGSHSHLLLTVDAVSGGEVSKIELPDRIECQVEFVHRKMALVGCYDGHLYAFDFSNGTILWSKDCGGRIKAKPLVVGEIVIVGTYGEEINLLCICLRTRKFLWRLKIGTGSIFSSPVPIGTCSVLVCTLSGCVARIEIATSAILWEVTTSVIFSTPTLIFDEELFVLADVNGLVEIRQVANGQALHNFKVEGNVFSSITAHAIDAKTVLVLFGCNDHNIYSLKYTRAVAGNSLELMWKRKLESPIVARPLLVAHKSKYCVVACSTRGLVALVDLQTGLLVGCYDVKAEIFSSPCFQDPNKIFFGCRDNFLYCLSVQ